jgi:hypothetical protein
MNMSQQIVGQYLKTDLDRFLSVPSVRVGDNHLDVQNDTCPLDRYSVNIPRMEHNVSQQDKSCSLQFDIAHALYTLSASYFYTVI